MNNVALIWVVMQAMLDTGFVYALVDDDDAQHARVSAVAQTLIASLILPVSVLPEVCYLIGSRLGHAAMRRFLGEVTAWNIQLETITAHDLARVTQVLDQYADARLDFVDATLVAIAERLNITTILTVDRRDFSIIRPRHCPYFELLP